MLFTTKKKIIIVENESIIALDLKLRLENFGYNVMDTAFNGEDVIEKIGEINPDIVLMDIQLNGNLDGIQIANEIHKLYNIPFIYLSGHDSTILKREKETESSGFITKPFEDTEIQKAIETKLNTKMD